MPICILAAVATFIAGYMGLYQWELVSSVWDPFFGKQTQEVLDSDVAEKMHRWFRGPDAALGALAYLGDAIFGLAGSTRRWQYRPWMVLIFGLDVIPLGLVSAILVILQATVVGQWCFLCLVTAVISLLLVYWAYDEVLSCLYYLYRVWKQAPSKTIFWKALAGIPTPEAVRIGEEFLREWQEKHPAKSRDRHQQHVPQQT